jgi:predicted  nucleic acid-binding Zn-ribbon protein
VVAEVMQDGDRERDEIRAKLDAELNWWKQQLDSKNREVEELNRCLEALDDEKEALQATVTELQKK